MAVSNYFYNALTSDKWDYVPFVGSAVNIVHCYHLWVWRDQPPSPEEGVKQRYWEFLHDRTPLRCVLLIIFPGVANLGYAIIDYLAVRQGAVAPLLPIGQEVTPPATSVKQEEATGQEVTPPTASVKQAEETPQPTVGQGDSPLLPIVPVAEKLGSQVIEASDLNEAAAEKQETDLELWGRFLSIFYTADQEIKDRDVLAELAKIQHPSSQQMAVRGLFEDALSVDSSSRACIALADAYLDGFKRYLTEEDVDKGFPCEQKALTWYSEAARKGDPGAMDTLSKWYRRGSVGVLQNPDLAAHWETKAKEARQSRSGGLSALRNSSSRRNELVESKRNSRLSYLRGDL